MATHDGYHRNANVQSVLQFASIVPHVLLLHTTLQRFHVIEVRDTYDSCLYVCYAMDALLVQVRCT